MTIARELANYAYGLQFDDLTEATVHEVRRRVIDSLACALGAYRSATVEKARHVARMVSGTPGATALGLADATSPEMAAFVNGVLFRYLDYNDTYLSKEPAHPSDNLAAVFAMAEAHGASGRDIVVATVIAYEIQCRLCDAASIRMHGWDHVTYGTLSTAAACSRLANQTPTQIEHALSLAAVPNVAMRQTRSGELSEWKGCAFANASRSGVFAARLAGAGLTGPAPLFEGEMGFCNQLSGPIELPEFGGTTHQEFMIRRTSIKYWPAEYHSQSAIEAAISLREHITSIDDVSELRIDSFDAAVDIIGRDPEKWSPKTRETADHSLPYCTAVALRDGTVTLDSFNDDRLNDPHLRNFLQRIRVERDDELTARYPAGIPNRLTADLTDGRTITAESEFPPGHAENPLTDAQVEEKFRRLADGVLAPSQQDEVLGQCWRVDELDSITPLLGCFPAIVSD